MLKPKRGEGRDVGTAPGNTVGFDHPREVTTNAKECQHPMVCLSKGPSVCCPVVSRISDDFVFVKAESTLVCPYRTRFGFSSHVCGCPVRNELFHRFGL